MSDPTEEGHIDEEDIETTFVDSIESNESPVSAFIAPSAPIPAIVPQKKLFSVRDLMKFYKGREDNLAKHPDRFNYDESGNLVERNKEEIVKTILLPTYRYASLDERKEEEDKRLQAVLEKNDAFDRARQALYDAYQDPSTPPHTILELNREVARADIRLKYEENAHQHVFLHYARMPSEPDKYRIQMKDLHFENANEDKAVYDNIAIVQTRKSSLLLDMRVNEDAPEMVDLYKAKADEEIRTKKEAGLKTVISQINKKTDEEKASETLLEKGKLKAHGFQYLAYLSEIPTVKPTMLSIDEIRKRLVPKKKYKIGTAAAAAAPAAPVVAPIVPAPLKKLRKIVIPEAEPVPVAAELVAAEPVAAEPAPIVSIKKKYKIVIPTEPIQESAAADSKKTLNNALFPGRVFIASKTPPRQPGKRVDPPTPMKAIDVTSGQATESETRRDFSPMTPVEGGYKGYWNFEHYWQSGKVFEGVDIKTARAWWKKQVEPKRRYPGSKDLRVLHACWDPVCNDKMDWVTSRKRIYVPEYFELMKDRPSAIALREYIAKGNDVVIYDYDGPRNPDRSNSIMEVTVENLKEKINATDFPFGHGYIVAAWLKNITPDQYI